MARKPALSLESLSGLGVEKLARIVLDETGRNAPFRKIVNAALAATKGPDAIAKLIDRRLGALERATGFIEWEKVRAFRDDLQATVLTITGELAPASAPMAVDRLLRFIATEEDVLDRVDDSSGRIENVYYQAITAIGEVAGKLKPDEAEALPQRIMTALDDGAYDRLVHITNVLAQHLSEEVLLKWDLKLAELQREEEAANGKGKNPYSPSNASHLRSARQAIARARGDIDSLVRLEAEKHPRLQNTIAMAERLLEAGRAKEALDWVRKSPVDLPQYASNEDLAYAVALPGTPAPHRVSLEAAILTKLGERDAAQALRWEAFEATLSAGILREYISALPDFEEFDVLDRAFAHALSAGRHYSALTLFLDWPRFDLAAKLVMENQGGWDGQHYSLLAPAAEMLEELHPLAATLVYRALIDDILTRANSPAYGHAARYLSKLDLLAPLADADAARGATISNHAYYKAAIRKTHGRKYGFWSQVKAG